MSVYAILRYKMSVVGEKAQNICKWYFATEKSLQMLQFLRFLPIIKSLKIRAKIFFRGEEIFCLKPVRGYFGCVGELEVHFISKCPQICWKKVWYPV